MAPQAIKKVDSLNEACCEIGFLDELAKLMEKRGLDEIHLKTGSTEIELFRGGARRNSVLNGGGTGGYLPAMPMPMASQGQAIGVSSANPSETQGDSSQPALPLNGKLSEAAITSPMVGTVYLSPKPDEPQFVTVGQSVKQGQTLLIIEAMKVMNQIQATKAGKVVAIYVENSQPVEYGQPLLLIE